MFVVIVPQGPISDKNGKVTIGWQQFFEQMLQILQEALSNEGFQIPSISSAAGSVTPPTAGGQLLQVQNSFGLQGGAQAGTLVFDPAEVNGGSGPAPNGQLKVLLADGVFHPVTNT